MQNSLAVNAWSGLQPLLCWQMALLQLLWTCIKVAMLRQSRTTKTAMKYQVLHRLRHPGLMLNDPPSCAEPLRGLGYAPRSLRIVKAPKSEDRDEPAETSGDAGCSLRDVPHSLGHTSHSHQVNEVLPVRAQALSTDPFSPSAPT